MDKAIYRYITVPVIIVLGVFITGAVIQDLFGIADAPRKLLTAVGGVSALGFYFQRQIRG